MANKVIKRTNLAHYYESNTPCEQPISPDITEVDKTKSISELSNKELRNLIERLRDEREAENIVRDLRRSSGEKDTYETSAKIDTTTPIDQLYHYGILGQKWGIRRFQKLDGTRTNEGKKREIEKSEDHAKSRENKRKAPEGLSNEELKKLNERLQLETTYKKLTTEKIEKSESFVKKALKDAGGQALTEFSKGIFLGTAKLLIKELSPSFAETAFNIKEKK